MSKIAIVTDSSPNLPAETVQKYKLHIVPQTIMFGDEAFLDGIEISTSEFYRRLREGPHHPKTTQPNPEDFTRAYEKVAPGHDGILAIVISSQLSGTYDSAITAAQSFTTVPVRVVDSLSTSMGEGLAVLAAAELAAQGATLDEVEAAARYCVDNTKVIFVVDTLEFLHRGGRIGGASKFLGTALSIKPLLHFDQGRIEPLERVRTKAKAVDRMLELVTQYADGRPVQAAVIHAAVPEEAAALRPRVRQALNCMELYEADLSPAIATHAGPGTIAVAVCPA
jgi:DegV family protein with EDD domain